jgi:ABC-type transport system involved in cytochrome bd biosynthesis fused ATPase/permease subunit
MKALRRLIQGRTVVLITHDRRNLEGMDRVVYLEKGRIVREEKGPVPPAEVGELSG